MAKLSARDIKRLKEAKGAIERLNHPHNHPYRLDIREAVARWQSVVDEIEAKRAAPAKRPAKPAKLRTQAEAAYAALPSERQEEYQAAWKGQVVPRTPFTSLKTAQQAFFSALVAGDPPQTCVDHALAALGLSRAANVAQGA